MIGESLRYPDTTGSGRPVRSASRVSVPSVACGLERLCAGLAGREPPPLDPALMARVRRAAGLVTHPAAVTRDLTSAVEALQGAGAGLVALFGPEHGVRGEAPDGRPVPSGVDARSGLPAYSLYRGSAAHAGEDPRAPSAAMLRGLEVLLIDLQDIGARFYTFASTVSLCMQAAAALGIPVVILDRPNPIGDAIEGPLLQPQFASFVGLHPLPIRHGCTLGELALLFHRAFGVGDEPAIVDNRWLIVDGEDESDFADPSTINHPLSTRTWVPPSPNMPAPLTALIYPGTALLEGTNVSEGRGTAKPFEWLGAPWVDGDALADRLRGFDLPGAAFRPVHFIPSASKWAGETCAGVQVHVLEATAFRPVLTGAAILAALRELSPAEFAWREQDGRYPLDNLAGSDRLRLDLDAGRAPAAIAAGWQQDEAAFAATRAAYLARDEVRR